MLLAGVRQLVCFLWCTQNVEPALRQMCEDCDAELFLVLPRLLMLSLLSDPSGPVSALARRLLPERFFSSEDGSPAQLCKLSHSLHRVLSTVTSTIMAGKDGGMAHEAWIQAQEIVMRRAVVGNGAEADPCAQLESPWRKAASADVEGLMNEVERSSMELARRCPETWNELSDLLVQCITWRPRATRLESDSFVV